VLRVQGLRDHPSEGQHVPGRGELPEEGSVMEFVVFDLMLTGFALLMVSVVMWVVRQDKVSVVAELASMLFLTAAVWVLYHFGTWSPEWLQLVGAASFSLLMAVWGSGLIGRAQEAFLGSGNDADTGLPPLVAVDDTKPGD
jgi:hypothetical protein